MDIGPVDEGVSWRISFFKIVLYKSLTKNTINERAIRILAIAATFSRELTAYAWDVAVMEVSSKVKKKMKNLETSIVNPEELL